MEATVAKTSAVLATAEVVMASVVTIDAVVNVVNVVDAVDVGNDETFMEKFLEASWCKTGKSMDWNSCQALASRPLNRRSDMLA